jgi:gamma-glutamylcyclotransferase (GGCT)/AIG2-like uncharacterized protein YtfP
VSRHGIVHLWNADGAVDPAALTGVAAKDLLSRPASLRDHVVLQLRELEFPGMLRRSGCQAHGIVHAVPERVVDLLDAFEGELYERRAVAVELAAGAPARAQAYLLCEAAWSLTVEAPWDAAEFVRRRGVEYAAACRRFRAGRS